MAYASSHKESEEGREHRQKQDITTQHPQMEVSPVLKHNFLSIQYFFRENTVKYCKD